MSADAASGHETRQVLAIASIHRTGSTLLCSILRATHAAGTPMEYLNIHTHNFTTFRERHGVPRLAARGLAVGALRRLTGRAAWRSIDYFTRESWVDYLRTAARVATTPNGVFGIKVHWNQYDEHMLRRGLDAGVWGVPVRWVRIVREDEVRQAISLVRAEQSHQWNSNMTATAETRYDEAAIERAIAAIRAANASWDAHFARIGASPVRVSYEQLTRDPDATVRRVVSAAGVTLETVPPPQTTRQSDGESARWAERFLAARPEYASRAATMEG
jgi:LPS sulfotransferase NodH